MKPSTVALKRTPFARAQSIEAREVLKVGRQMKSKGSRMTPIRNSAKGEACTLRFPCCNSDPATTVWCHSNSGTDGKGMGLKARDEEGCYGCSACHAWLDGGYAGHMPREAVDKFFDLARTDSREILRRKGLLKNESATDCESAAPSHQKITLGETS